MIVDTMNFSAGESHVSVEDILSDRESIIHDYGFGPFIYFPKPSTLSLNDYIFSLLLIRNILQAPDLGLFLPYLPYSRQDRRTQPRYPESLRVFTDLLKTAQFKRIYTLDAHSEVSEALLPNLVNIRMEEIFRRSIRLDLRSTEMTLVVPDQGACKRLSMVEQYFQDVIYVTKKRDPDTGKVHIKDISGDPRFVDLLIMDDICDGGRTFIEIANRLKGYTSLSLYTTHGIYSQGLCPLIESGIARFYTTDSITISRRDILNHALITTYSSLDILQTAMKSGAYH